MAELSDAAVLKLAEAIGKLAEAIGGLEEGVGRIAREMEDSDLEEL